MTTTMSTMRGGGSRRGHCRVVIAPSSFDAAGAVANVCIAVIAVWNDDGVHRPPEVCQHSRASIPIPPYRNVFISLNGKGKGEGAGGGFGVGSGKGGGEGGKEGGGEGVFELLARVVFVLVASSVARAVARAVMMAVVVAGGGGGSGIGGGSGGGEGEGSGIGGGGALYIIIPVKNILINRNFLYMKST